MSEIDAYLEKFSPVQLRHSIKVKTDSRFSSYNFGKSKGKTFDRVLIYPTADIKKWLANKNNSLADPTRAALYVAITRARYSVAFVIPDNEIGLIYNIDVWSA
jgi:superfamily I DNA/RNA helicase